MSFYGFMEKLNYAVMFLACVTLVLTCYFMIQLFKTNTYLTNYIMMSESDKWYTNGTYKNTVGYARGDLYYCVVTKDQTESEIMDTDCHEKAHVIITKSNESKKHFCGA